MITSRDKLQIKQAAIDLLLRFSIFNEGENHKVKIMAEKCCEVLTEQLPSSFDLGHGVNLSNKCSEFWELVRKEIEKYDGKD